MNKLIIIVFLSFLLIARQAISFDCAHPVTDMDKIVCSSREKNFAREKRTIEQEKEEIKVNDEIYIAKKKEEKQKSRINIKKASKIGPDVANDIGTKWLISKTKDSMTDEIILNSDTAFGDESFSGYIHVVFNCNLSKGKEFTVTATAYDSKGDGVQFIQNNNKNVNLTVRFDNNPPIQTIASTDNYRNELVGLEKLPGVECQQVTDKVLSNPMVMTNISVQLRQEQLRYGTKMTQAEVDEKIIKMLLKEYPQISCLLQEKVDKWLELSEIRIQFPLKNGKVIARIAPYEENLHKVLEFCAEP